MPKGEEEAAKRLQLLTAKPVLYVCNVEEAAAATGNAFSERVVAMAKAEGASAVVVSAAIEAEIARWPPADRREFSKASGCTRGGLDRVIRAGYALLGLHDLLHRRAEGGPRLDHHPGAKAPQAAGVIHGDFERGFIACETIAYDDYVALGGEQGAKEAGKMRVEGKEYVVKDGDILLFRFNVGRGGGPAMHSLFAWSPRLCAALPVLLAFLLAARPSGRSGEWRRHPGGLRSCALRPAAACVFARIAVAHGGGKPGAALGAIATGVGFLGAGVILRRGSTERGLSTAATFWRWPRSAPPPASRRTAWRSG